MRIAVITLGVYPIQIGGVEILVYKQLQKLTKKGHEVVCFTKKTANDVQTTKSEPYTVRRVGSATPILGQFWFLFSVTWSLIRMRKELDVVHVQYASYFIIPAYVLRLLAGLPYVVGCVGSDLLLWGKRRLWARSLGVLLRGATFTTALSTELKSILIEKYGVPADRAVLLPNPFDDEDVANVPDGFPKAPSTVTFLGNLKPVKDPMTAIRAFAIVHKRLSGSSLVMVGEGPCRAEITSFVRAHELENNVILKGSQRHEDALRELSGSDLLVVSSLAEGGPIAAMEAMALGVPVVGTNVGGLKDLISDGINGYLVATRNPEQLAEAMYRLLADRPLAERMAAEARKTISGRTWTNLIGAYEELYTRAIAMQPRRK